VQKWHRSHKDKPNATATLPHAKPLHAASGGLQTVLPDVAEFKAKNSVATTMNNCTKSSEITKENRLRIFTLCLLNVVIEKNTYIVIKLCLFNVLIF
jgi:hypothetical protein